MVSLAVAAFPGAGRSAAWAGSICARRCATNASPSSAADDVRTQVTAVEDARALLGDVQQRAGEVGVLEPLASARRAGAVHQEGGAGAVVPLQLRGLVGPLARDDRRDGEAFVRVADRG